MIALKKIYLLFVLTTACICMMASVASDVWAQNIQTSTPFNTVGDSYYENTGVRFGLNFGGGSRIVGLNPAGQILPNVSISQGSAGATVPAFGGFDPNSSLNTGFAVVGGDVGVSFGLTAGKGFNRSNVSQTPSVVTQNGQFGSIFSGSQQPFVTRIDPVVGMGMNNGFTATLRGRSSLDLSNLDADPKNMGQSLDGPRTYSDESSTANQGDISIAEIQRLKALGQSAQHEGLKTEIAQLMVDAEDMISQGKFGAARAKYGRALRKVGDNTDMVELRDSLSEKLESIRDKR